MSFITYYLVFDSSGRSLTQNKKGGELLKTLVVNQTFESRSNINILYKLSFKFTYANYWTRNWDSSFQKQYFTTREFFAGTVLKLRIDKMYFCIV